MPYLKSTMYLFCYQSLTSVAHTNSQSLHLEVPQLETLKHVSFCVHCRQLFNLFDGYQAYILGERFRQ